ncbi:MAG: right-handed parallel beta-helix repeat-containing protein [Nitrososphaerota archaeon]|nr:right-handed parallel beta-helix repeat-containing protein [Nitrososphaerota archaeon]
MNKSPCLLIILLLMSVTGLHLFSAVSANTYVSNIPNGYATWTPDNNPYELTTNLVINNGETLNIQPGVVVHLNGYQIQVHGRLNAQGANNNKISFLNNGLSNSQIIFKASSDQTCTINYGVFYSVPITIEGGAPKITNSYFTGTTSAAVITINAGAASITDNIITTQNPQTAIHINTGYVTITQNILSGARGQQGYGIYNTGSTAPITGNTITNFYTGIYTNKPGTIKQNTIINNVNDGIVTAGVLDVTVSNNVIAYNKCGISRDANIQNNLITHNTYGLWGQTSSSTIRYNNIIDNTDESIHLTETGVNVIAIDNWWGTTDESTIRQTISDYDPDLRPFLGTVTFTPFLTSFADTPRAIPEVVVPTPPPTPSSTPSPSATVTPTPSSNPTYPWVYPTDSFYPEPTLFYPTMLPTESPNEPGFGGFSESDIITAVVIVIAIGVVVTIVFIVSRGQTNMRQFNNPP